MKTLLCIVITLLMSCKADRDLPPGQIPFRLINNIPVVEGSLNGKKVSFIVDSGASISVLDISQQKRFKFNTYDQGSSAIGYGGVANFKEVLGADLVLGDSIAVSANFRAQDLSTLVSAIKTHEGINIAGILGSDVWNKLDAIIDFKAKCIVVTNW
jgi:hypothetical protein